MQEKAAEPKEKKAAKTVESKTEAPAAAEPNEPVSLIEKVRKYVRKPKKTETPAPAGQTENIAETPFRFFWRRSFFHSIFTSMKHTVKIEFLFADIGQH